MFGFTFSRSSSCCDDVSYGEVKDGYQYCQGCGCAILAPVRKVDTTCCTQHKWKILHELSICTGHAESERVTAIKYIGQCENCGNIQVDIVSVKH